MSETFWNEQARIRADHVEHLRDIIRCLKTGTCWFGKGIDNPMVTEHTSHCNAAMREMSGIRHGGRADRWLEHAAEQPVYTSVPGGGVEPHGIDTRTRAPGVVRDGTETPSNGGKHG